MYQINATGNIDLFLTSLASRGIEVRMMHKKAKKELGNATRASVMKEMAKPRIARSARIAELNLDTARIPEQPSATVPTH